MKHILMTACVALGLTTAALAQQRADYDPFPNYSDKARGWFWKEIEPEPPAPLLEQPPQEPPKATAEPSGPVPLSAAWIKTNLPKYRERAIDDPSPQNIRDYLYLQRYTLDVSERFADAVKRVTLGDPELDSNTRRPVWTAGANAMDDAAGKQKSALLEGIAKKFGIWFFFRSDCEYCEIQAPALKVLERVYGFSVLAISIDGKGMPNGTFPNFVRDAGQAQKLGVESTPAMFLVRPPDGVIPIGEGMLAADELAMRIVELANQAGVVSDEQYSATRGDKKKLLPPPAALRDLPAEVAKTPTALTDELRALLKNPTRTR